MLEAFSLFTFIGLAALPGRTTFILITLSANENPWRVFFGAAAAFLLQAFLSVLAGGALAYVPLSYVEVGAGLLFLYFAYKFWAETKSHGSPLAVNGSHASMTFRSVFILIFVAEIGDVSQLAIATSASRASSKPIAFFAAVAALWMITVIAIVLGRTLGHLLKPTIIQRLASAIFLLVGIYLVGAGLTAQLA